MPVSLSTLRRASKANAAIVTALADVVEAHNTHGARLSLAELLAVHRALQSERPTSDHLLLVIAEQQDFLTAYDAPPADIDAITAFLRAFATHYKTLLLLTQQRQKEGHVMP